MKQFILCFLLVLGIGLQAQEYRYTESVFSEVSIISDVVYTTAPRLSGVYNDESNTVDDQFLMDIYQPVGDELSTRPAIIFVHGGAFVTGNRHHDDMVSFCDSLAHKGYVTATIDYRQGMYITSEASATRAVYRGLQDGRSAVRFLRANAATYGIDPAKVYMAGSSAGAFICLQSVYMNAPDEKPDEAKGYSYTNPLFPFNQINAPDLGGYDLGDNLTFNGTPDAIFSLWGAIKNTSLVKAGDNIPVYLIHGTNDQTVPFGIGSPFGYPAFPATYGSGPISTKINELGYTQLDTWFVEGEGHEFYGVANGTWAPEPNKYWPTTVEKATSFFWQQHKPTAGFRYTSSALDVNFTSESVDANAWFWDFGDGQTSRIENPNHSYSASGTYTVTLHVENKIKSWDELSMDVTINNTGISEAPLRQVSIYPNPVNDILYINNLPDGTLVELFSVNGQLLKHYRQTNSKLEINMENLPKGLYLLNLSNQDEKVLRKIINPGK